MHACTEWWQRATRQMVDAEAVQEIPYNHLARIRQDLWYKIQSSLTQVSLLAAR